MRLPAVLWPQERCAENTAAIRLARVIHWLSAICAGTVVALGLLFTVVGYQNAAESRRDIAGWGKRHPGAPASNSAYDEFSEVVDFSQDPDPMPIEYEASILPLLATIGAAFVIVMAGRGIRYILANE